MHGHGHGMVHPLLLPCRRAQLGLWTRAQARDVGIAYSTLRAWTDAHRVVEPFPGVYADAAVELTWAHRALAARLWAGGDAVLSHHTAARVLDLRLPRSSELQPVHLLVRERTFATPAGVIVHRSRRVPDTHVHERHPHVLTTATRTICDLAGHVGPVALRRLVSQTVRDELATPAQLRTAMDALGRFRGKVGLRQVLDELSPLESRTRSELESLYLRVMRPLGLQPDVVNHPVTDITGRRRYLDAAYLPEHVPVELDSRSEHGTLLDWHDDTRRENDITLTGRWQPFLRFSWDDLTNHVAEVAERVRLALRAAGTTRSL